MQLYWICIYLKYVMFYNNVLFYVLLMCIFINIMEDVFVFSFIKLDFFLINSLLASYCGVIILYTKWYLQSYQFIRFHVQSNTNITALK